MPKYKNKIWDGKIHLLIKGKYIYKGLLNQLIQICNKFNIKYKINFETEKIPINDVFNYTKNLKLKYEPRNYQLKSVLLGITQKNAIIESPTGSGKSLIIYMYIKYILDNIINNNEKILLIVPKISLVYQMRDDFIDYNKDIEKDIHIIIGGLEKQNEDKSIFISTWQSIYNQNPYYFKQFKCLIIDEVHGAKANSLKKICENSINANFRLGLTGTLQDCEIDRLQLIGLLGNIYKVETTKNLIDKGLLSKLIIYNLIFKYNLNDKILANGLCYDDEKKFILNNRYRFNKIIELSLKTKNNTLILFERIKYGEKLYTELTNRTDSKKIFYIDGSMKKNKRRDLENTIKYEFENSDNVILIASSKLYSTGINIKNIHNIILTLPEKSKIELLQKIGRGLRIHKSKSILKIIDIVDDLRMTKEEIMKVNNIKLTKKMNFAYRHYKERINYYKNEKFEYKDVIVYPGA